MLTALETGVRGSKWHSLIDKVYAWDNLVSAYQRVAANKGAPGVDHVTTDAFARHLEENLSHLHQALETGTYRPQAIRRVHIPKPGSKETRPLGIPTVRDRVAQAAVKNVLEPIFERDFAEQSYGFRPGRSCKDALRRADALLKDGYRYVVDADLKSYFDTIPHAKLLDLIRAKVSDTRVLSLIALFLEQGVIDALGTHVPEQGSPQGAVISPLLSNIYLDGLDHLMVAHGFEMVRYADDFVVLTRSQEQAQRALSLIAHWVKEAELLLHPQKTGIVTHEQGFDFLGYHFQAGRRWPRKKSLMKLKDTIRARTKRTNGHSLAYIITDVNAILRGWYEYYKHSHETTCHIVDGWVRMRLRSILRRRDGRIGPGRGFDHRCWPNAYFASHGLLSLRAAYDIDRQSSLR
jgi:RNA-directed DNA polymerase